jgi:hypothetical protein
MAATVTKPTSVLFDPDAIARVREAVPELAFAPLGQIIRAGVLVLTGVPVAKAVELGYHKPGRPFKSDPDDDNSAGVAA